MPDYQYLYTAGDSIDGETMPEEHCSSVFHEENDEEAIDLAADFLEEQDDISELLLIEADNNGVKRLVADLHIPPREVHIYRYGATDEDNEDGE